MLEIICLFSNFPSAYNMLFPKIRFLLCYYWFLFCFISSQKTPEPRNISPTSLASPRNCFSSLPIPSRMGPIFPYLVSEMFPQRASQTFCFPFSSFIEWFSKKNFGNSAFVRLPMSDLCFEKKAKLKVEVHLVVRGFVVFFLNKIYLYSLFDIYAKFYKLVQTWEIFKNLFDK